jgi:hypothetical protein
MQLGLLYEAVITCKKRGCLGLHHLLNKRVCVTRLGLARAARNGGPKICSAAPDVALLLGRASETVRLSTKKKKKRKVRNFFTRRTCDKKVLARE